jgi:hypothetical protein
MADSDSDARYAAYMEARQKHEEMRHQMVAIPTVGGGEPIDLPRLAIDIDQLMKLSEDEREKYELWGVVVGQRGGQGLSGRASQEGGVGALTAARPQERPVNRDHSRAY